MHTFSHKANNKQECLSYHHDGFIIFPSEGLSLPERFEVTEMSYIVTNFKRYFINVIVLVNE